jgi:hypothetical protein
MVSESCLYVECIRLIHVLQLFFIIKTIHVFISAMCFNPNGLLLGKKIKIQIIYINNIYKNINNIFKTFVILIIVKEIAYVLCTK